MSALALPRRRLSGRTSLASVLARAGNPLELALFAVVPAIMLAFLLRMTFSPGLEALDFRNVYWAAGHRVLLGENPYLWTHAQIVAGYGFVYPAPTALAYLPFALISCTVGRFAVTAIWIALAPAAIRIVGVRDWRLYGVALLYAPVFEGWQSANLTLLLLLGCALVWRYRDRRLVAGCLAGLAMSLKPFAWPIVLWLALTGRWRAAMWALVTALILNVVGWGALGFGAVHDYLHLISSVTAAHWTSGYGVPALLAHVGAPHRVGSVVEGLLVIALVAGIAWQGLVRQSESRALVLSVGLMLVATPLVWTHYFAVLLLPLAIVVPKLKVIWLAPLLLWLCPTVVRVELWQMLVAWGITLTCLYWLFRKTS